MKPKLKPRKYAGNAPYEPIVEFRTLYRVAAELVSDKRADEFAFDLMEVDRACGNFRSDIMRFLKALRSAKKDSTDLYDTSSDVSGTLEEFRKHGRRATRLLNELGTLARKMPPLDKATDLQLTERALAPFDKFLPPKKATRKRTRPVASKTGKKKSMAARAKKKKTTTRRT